MDPTLWIPALLILIGLAGIIIPILPGLILVLAGVFVWALSTRTTLAWTVFGVAAVLYVAGVALQYAVPGRGMRQAGVRTSTLVLGVLLGCVGFFVIPVVGGVLGFVLGIYLVELARSNDARLARTATSAALKAVVVSMGIELLAAFAITCTWVAGVLLSP